LRYASSENLVLGKFGFRRDAETAREMHALPEGCQRATRTSHQ